DTPRTDVANDGSASPLASMQLPNSPSSGRWIKPPSEFTMALQADHQKQYRIRAYKYPDWQRQKVCWIRKRHFLSFNEIAQTMDMPASAVRDILRKEGLGGPVSELRKKRIELYKADGLSVKEIASRV